MEKNKKKKISSKMILLIVGVLIFSLIVGFNIGKYLFEITYPDALITNNR